MGVKNKHLKLKILRSDIFIYSAQKDLCVHLIHLLTSCLLSFHSSVLSSSYTLVKQNLLSVLGTWNILQKQFVR